MWGIKQINDYKIMNDNEGKNQDVASLLQGTISIVLSQMLTGL